MPVFVARNGHGQIYGIWTVRQFQGQEELSNNHPEVVAFLNPPPKTAEQHEQDALSALNGGGAPINMLRLMKAKFISDLAWRIGKAPGALTNAELNAERSRIAAIYKAL